MVVLVPLPLGATAHSTLFFKALTAFCNAADFDMTINRGAS